MADCNGEGLLVAGLGVVSAIGCGQQAFLEALLEGRHAFSMMRRPGRQLDSTFIGAEIDLGESPEADHQAGSRAMSFSSRVALMTLAESWRDADLDQIDPARIGLVIGGSNFQQRAIERAHAPCAATPYFIKPSYAMQFMDTDLCGVCTERFAIRGFAYTLGAASASGQMAVIQAAQAVRAGDVDVCIALGPVMDLSYWECHGFRSLGAMGSDRFADSPALACRPFDRDRDGFIYGESSAAVVIERESSARQRRIAPYARIAGWSVAMDGNRNPNPSLDGEVCVIRQAMARAGWQPRLVDYVNPHGSGSVLGDETELNALAGCGLRHAAINASKALIGHGLASAGLVETVATLLQMKVGQLHPNRNLEHPLDSQFAWVGARAERQAIRHALNLSYGFGGINTALCLEHLGRGQ
ncbi:polyketide beta-ketoacyl:ACP synthase [Pseudomonas oryzihabitans]|nr:polyketide beta-ketoacyl:ACP synthase [Pseudomonas psychrotolerans]